MMPEKKKFTLIGTHNGQFHCDEALACFMLKLLPDFKDCRILRSREKEKLDLCDIVVDVGAIYDPSIHRYDHHQRDFKTTLNDIHPDVPFFTKLSSAGLVYAHFGSEILRQVIGSTEDGESAVNSSDLKLIFPKVYENFVEEIDAVDNGINVANTETLNYRVTTTISNRVGFLNPKWNENSSDKVADEQFEKAMNLVGREFSERVLSYVSVWLPGRIIVERAIKNRLSVHNSGSILLFPDVCPPWKEHLFTLEREILLMDAKKIYYVLYQDSSNKSWRVQCVPVAEGSFTNRLSLPEAWRGVRDEQLSQLSGIDGCIFVHSSGFIGGNSTFDGALKMATVSLQSAK